MARLLLWGQRMISRMLSILCVLSLLGCAAMKRTWSFRATPVQGSRLKVTVTKAKVKQSPLGW